jgi:hypothetical protein
MALIRNIAPLSGDSSLCRDDSQNNGLEKGWAAAAQIKSDVCLCGDRCQLQ